MDDKTFKSKLQVLEKNNKEEQKRKSTYEHFLLQSYTFTVVKQVSPRKPALMSEVEKLKKS